MAKKHRKDEQFIKKPIYIGGMKAMREFISKNIKYPPEALKNKIEGSVHLSYEIDYKGNVIKSTVISGLGYGCDEESKRLVGLLKFEIPKNPRKLKVKFTKKLKINFKLPKASVKSQPVLQYNINLKPKKEEPKTTSYNYTINIS
jgi:protein TonB